MPPVRARASAPSKRRIEKDARSTPSRSFPSTDRVVSAQSAVENDAPAPSKADYKRDGSSVRAMEWFGKARTQEEARRDIARHFETLIARHRESRDDLLDRYGLDVNELDVSGLNVSPKHIERVAESLRGLEKRIAHGELKHDELVSYEEADEAWTFMVKLLRAMYRRRGYELPR